MAFALAPAVDDADPIGSINVTLLIDVLLVLLIMLILTIPIATHEVPLNLPVGGTHAPATPQHRLNFAAEGTLTLDGAPISDAALPAALARLGDGALVIDADPATRYGRFDQVLAVVRRAGVTRLGFADNARFARF